MRYSTKSQFISQSVRIGYLFQIFLYTSYTSHISPVMLVFGLVLVLGEKSWSWSLALKSLLTSLYLTALQPYICSK